jgi:hypothetical protein
MTRLEEYLAHKFADSVLSLPPDTRRDVLGIANRECPEDPYSYLFKRVFYGPEEDHMYGLFLECGVITGFEVVSA